MPGLIGISFFAFSICCKVLSTLFCNVSTCRASCFQNSVNSKALTPLPMFLWYVIGVSGFVLIPSTTICLHLSRAPPDWVLFRKGKMVSYLIIPRPRGVIVLGMRWALNGCLFNAPINWLFWVQWEKYSDAFTFFLQTLRVIYSLYRLLKYFFVPHPLTLSFPPASILRTFVS